jgi:hypothetical protein
LISLTVGAVYDRTVSKSDIDAINGSLRYPYKYL